MSEPSLPLIVTLALGVAALIGWILFSAWRTRQRASRFSEPFPPEWRSLLRHSVPLYQRMPSELRAKLEPVVRAFLHDVEFIGCNGLVVTDDMRLTVAAQACLLVVARDPHAYASLHSVLLYPEEFVVKETDQDDDGIVHEGESVLSGQSVDTSRIVLSWPDVLDHGTDGEVYNVVLHEFAHYLDNAVDGMLTDTGSRREAFEAWHQVLDTEYQSLCDAVDRDEETLIDPYGAESTIEFFAVATETFFERPLDMQHLHPALYAKLASFYGLSPATW